MHLLLTRPAAEAERTRIKLEGMGHRVTVAPVTTVVSLAPPWPSDTADALVATSAHAFMAGALGGAPRLDELRRLPLLLVGERTEAAARRLGFGGTARVAATATQLLGMVGQGKNAPQRLLYLAGRDRKPDLEQGLRTLGLGLTVLDVYEAAPATALDAEAVAALRDGTIDGVLHFSRRSASLFLLIARSACVTTQGLRHYCISDDAAEPLRESNHRLVRVAAAPNEAALLATVADQA